jgi:hypothetical protein
MRRPAPVHDRHLPNVRHGLTLQPDFAGRRSVVEPARGDTRPNAKGRRVRRVLRGASSALGTDRDVGRLAQGQGGCSVEQLGACQKPSLRHTCR